MGKRSAAGSLFAVLTGLLVGGWFFLTRMAEDQREDAAPIVLTDTDRAALERRRIEGADYLVHPYVGFRILDPGPAFQPDDTTRTALVAAQVQKMGASGVRAAASVASWVYSDPATQRRLVISLMVSAALTPESFDAIVGEVARGLGMAPAELHPAYAPARSVAEASFAGPRGRGVVRLDTFQVAPPGAVRRPEYIVTIAGPESLSDQVRSLRIPDPVR